MWAEIAKRIRAGKRFIVTTHIHPEGDAIGSEVALATFLEDQGKHVTIVNSSSTPQNNRFMDPSHKIKVYPKDYRPEMLSEADQVIIVDVNNWSHVGPFGDEIRESSTPRMCIDHHQGVDADFADVVVSDTSAAAAGVLVYELIRDMGGDITPRIAEAVYAAIITDTGTFRFSNTDARVFRIAMDLTRDGINPFTLHRQVFSKTAAAVKLLGAVMSTLEYTSDGKLAWIHATRQMFDSASADYEDSDGILDIVRSTKSVEFCLFFKELPDGRVKVSLRSNGTVDVYEIAKHYGGGGHRMASGMSVNGPMANAIKTVVDAARKHIPA